KLDGLIFIRSKYYLFFFQAEDGIRVRNVTGVQTCALPISDFLAGLSRHAPPQPPTARTPEPDQGAAPADQSEPEDDAAPPDRDSPGGKPSRGEDSTREEDRGRRSPE